MVTFTVKGSSVKGNVAVRSIEEGLRLLRSPMGKLILANASNGAMDGTRTNKLRDMVKNITCETVQTSPYAIVTLKSDDNDDATKKNIRDLISNQMLRHPVRATKRDYKVFVDE